MTCMLCGKVGKLIQMNPISSKTKFNGNVGILELIVGNCVKNMDCICNVCMNIVSKLKKILCYRLLNSDRFEDINYDKMWDDVFALNGSNKESDVMEEDSDNLLPLSYFPYYNCTLKNELTEMEFIKNLIKNYYPKIKAKVTSTSKKRPGKIGRMTPVNCSNRHSSQRNDSSNADHIEGELVENDGNGKFSKEVIGCVSRAKSIRKKEKRFDCVAKDCKFKFQNSDVMNLHAILHHNSLALYFCEECQQRYVSLETLQIHQKYHDQLPFYCLMCKQKCKNQKALQEHLKEHIAYSVPCNYCDDSFVGVYSRNQHLWDVHKCLQKGIARKQIFISDRIDKLPEEESSVSRKKKKNTEEFKIFYMPYTDDK